MQSSTKFALFWLSFFTIMQFYQAKERTLRKGRLVQNHSQKGKNSLVGVDFFSRAPFLHRKLKLSRIFFYLIKYIWYTREDFTHRRSALQPERSEGRVIKETQGGVKSAHFCLRRTKKNPWELYFLMQDGNFLAHYLSDMNPTPREC